MIKNILWDNDGVLVDTEKYFFLANKDICKKFNIDFSLDDFRQLILENSIGPWGKFRKMGFSEEDIVSIRSERDRIYNSYILKENVTIKGVKQILEKLHRKYRMAIVTSSKREHFENIHKRTGFLKYFEFSLTIEDYDSCKPSKDPYIKALNVMDVKSDETIVIEDSRRGLIAAFAAGLKCIVIPTELTSKQDFSNAYKIIDTVLDLPDTLKSI